MAPDMKCVMPVNGCSRGYDRQLCEENVVVCRNMSFGFLKNIFRSSPCRGIAAPAKFLHSRHGVPYITRAMITFILSEPELFP
jgi:hypothetical protein